MLASRPCISLRACWASGVPDRSAAGGGVVFAARSVHPAGPKSPIPGEDQSRLATSPAAIVQRAANVSASTLSGTKRTDPSAMHTLAPPEWNEYTPVLFVAFTKY